VKGRQGSEGEARERRGGKGAKGRQGSEGEARGSVEARERDECPWACTHTTIKNPSVCVLQQHTPVNCSMTRGSAHR
jgi:hypothetical protein